MRKCLPLWAALAAMLFCWAAPAAAAQAVRIGVIYPLSGAEASVGRSLLAAARLAVEVANGAYPGLPMVMAQRQGWARLELVSADSGGDGLRAAEAARRLINEEKVAGILGCYASGVTDAVADVCEAAGVPMLNACSTDPALTSQGRQWFWRVSPHDGQFIGELFDFLNAIIDGKAPGVPAQARLNMQMLASACRDDAWGEANSRIIRLRAGGRGFSVGASLMYSPETPDLLTTARKLAMAQPAVILAASYERDAVKLMEALRATKARPLVIWGQDAGFESEGFRAQGRLVEGVCSRTVFSPALARQNPLAKAVNELYRLKTGQDLDGSTARVFTAVQVWAELLDLAGSAEAADIRAAAQHLHIAKDQLIVPWEGVRFGQDLDNPGQNALGRGLIGQYQMKDGRLTLEIVYPFELATAPLLFPFRGF